MYRNSMMGTQTGSCPRFFFSLSSSFVLFTKLTISASSSARFFRMYAYRAPAIMMTTAPRIYLDQMDQQRRSQTYRRWWIFDHIPYILHRCLLNQTRKRQVDITKCASSGSVMYECLPARWFVTYWVSKKMLSPWPVTRIGPPLDLVSSFFIS